MENNKVYITTHTSTIWICSHSNWLFLWFGVCVKLVKADQRSTLWMNESQSRPKLWLFTLMARLEAAVAFISTITQQSRASALPTMAFFEQLIFVNLKSCFLFVSQICEGWRGWNAGGWWAVVGWWVLGWCFGEGVNGWGSGQSLVGQIYNRIVQIICKMQPT